MSLIAELKRRSVFKVGAAYLVVAWLAIQAASILFPTFDAPAWTMRVFVLVMFIGFPIALVMAWVFEVGGGGVKIEGGGRDDLKFYGLIGAIAALAFGWYHFGQPAVRAPDALEADARSIAVLPFVNMSEDPANEYFSDGIAEEILNVLAKSPELRVAARTSSFSFKGQNLEIPDIAKELKVRMVLEGSVRKQGGKVRITAQLIDAQEGFHLWSETYDRDLKDVFAIQDEIARAIAKELQVKLVGGVAQAAVATSGAPSDPAVSSARNAAGNSVGTTNLEAYDLYLRGVALWQTRRSAELREAERLFEQAVALDPGFARAWAGIALVNTVSAFSLASGFEDVERRALWAASRAAQLDPTLAEPVAVFGNLDRRRPERWVSSLAYLRHAVSLNPSYATAHQWLGLGHLFLGDLGAAEAELRAARALDPRSIVIGTNMSLLRRVQGRDADALSICAEVFRIDPNQQSCMAIALGVALTSGDRAQVERLLAKLAAAKPGPESEALRAELAAALSGKGNRRAVAQRLAGFAFPSDQDPSSENFLNEWVITQLLVELGEPELAVARLADGAAERSDLVSFILWQKYLDPVRCHPRITAMVASWGVTDPHAAAVCGGNDAKASP